MVDSPFGRRIIELFNCQQCGAQLQSGMRFCSQCGFQFGQPVPEAPVAVSPGWEASQTVQTASAQQWSPSRASVQQVQPFSKAGLIKWGWFGEAWRYFWAAPVVWTTSVALPYGLLLIGEGILQWGKAFQPVSLESGQDVSALSVWAGDIVLAVNLMAPSLIFLAFLIQLTFNSSSVVIAKRQVRGETVRVSDLFHPGPFMWPLVGFNVIAYVLLIVGTMIMYVPGLLVIAFVFPAIALVADGIGIGEAIRRTIEVLKQDIVGSILFALAWNLLVLVSIIPCGLGLLATLPMVQLLLALLYRDLIGRQGRQAG